MAKPTPLPHGDPHDHADPATAPAWRLVLDGEAATARLGATLAQALAPGDALLLSGPLGAGKSVLARAAVRALMAAPDLEVPSPSYTLVNVYDRAASEVWHADLYRLGGAEEAAELGLEDAFCRAVVLVEWPERLGELAPSRRLEIALEPAGETAGETARRAEIRPVGTGWQAVADRLGAEGLPWR